MNNLHSFSKLHLNEKKPKPHFIKDPLLEEIDFPLEQYWLYEIINTYEFQRLINIKQLSLNGINFPSATHNRFCHSLGVYELCSRFIKHFLNEGYLDKEKHWKEINISLSYALLHDIGHGPLSHTFEKSFKGFHHEKMGKKIIESPDTKINLLLRKKAKDDGLPENFYVDEICKIFGKTSSHKWIQDLLTSDFDVDRLDFLKRDSYYSGVSYGNAINTGFLIKWSFLKEDEEKNLRLCFHPKTQNQLEQFFFSRRNMYLDLYHNTVTLIYEKILLEIIGEIKKLKVSLENKKSFKNIAFLFDHPDQWSAKEFLSLYDEKFLILIDELTEGEGGKIEEYRNLFFGFNTEENMEEFMEKNIDKSTVDRPIQKITIKLWNPKKNCLEDTIING